MYSGLLTLTAVASRFPKEVAAETTARTSVTVNQLENMVTFMMAVSELLSWWGGMRNERLIELGMYAYIYLSIK